MTDRPTTSLNQVMPNFKKTPTSAPKIGPKEAQTKALRETRTLETPSRKVHNARPEATAAKESRLPPNQPTAADGRKGKKMSAKKKAKVTAKKSAKKTVKRPARKAAKKAKSARSNARKAVRAPRTAAGGDKKVEQLITMLEAGWVSTTTLEKKLGWVNNTLRSTISNLKNKNKLNIQHQRLEGMAFYRIGE